jgi:ferrochelatase
MIIAPFRGPKSAKLYQNIWTEKGSPLLVNSIKLGEALQAEMGGSCQVFTVMRYGKPSMDDAMREIAKGSFHKLILVPLYPQYADSTTGTTVALYRKLIIRYAITAEVKIVDPFFQHPGFIESFKNRILACSPETYNHILFSFHGLPVDQTEKMHPGITCEQAGCSHTYNNVNTMCYKASCYETARLIANACKLPENSYSVAFQSRLGIKWLQPYTVKVVEEKATQGVENILVVSPAFVADCLETIYELGVEYNNLFTEKGGKKFQLIESLNDNPTWVKGLAEIIGK